MLRHYDEHCVLHPTRTDPWSGYRYYEVDLLRPAGAVRELRDVGLKVAELAECVPLLDDPAALRLVLKGQRSHLDAEADAVAERIRKVERLIHTLEERAMSEHTAVPVARREIPARTVASVRGFIPTYADEGLLWQRLWAGLVPAMA